MPCGKISDGATKPAETPHKNRQVHYSGIFNPLAGIMAGSGSRGGFEMQFSLKAFSRAQGGATAIEYAMVAFFISIAAFSALVTVGNDVNSLFTKIANGF